MLNHSFLQQVQGTCDSGSYITPWRTYAKSLYYERNFSAALKPNVTLPCSKGLATESCHKSVNRSQHFSNSFYRVHFQALSKNCENQLLASSLLSVCPPTRSRAHMKQLGSHCTDFHKIWYLSIFRKSVEKVQDSLKSDKNNCTLHEDQYKFMIISHSVLLRMRNV
jgi:hypothetical protein